MRDVGRIEKGIVKPCVCTFHLLLWLINVFLFTNLGSVVVILCLEMFWSDMTKG